MEQETSPPSKMSLNKIRKSQLLNAAILITLTGCSISPGASAEPADIWVLNQHGEEQGNTTIYISQDAVKVDNKEHGCQLLTRAPDWKVHCFRPREKVEWVGELSQFNGIMMVNPFALPQKQGTKNLVAIGKGSINGLKYTKYRTQRSDKDLLLTADDIQVDARGAEFLARLFYVPFRPNVPLYRLTDRGKGETHVEDKPKWIDLNSMKDLRGGMVTKLATTGWHKEPYNASTFAIPQGYKRINDIIQISYSKHDKSQVNDMINDIGFTSVTSTPAGVKKH